MRLYKTVLDIGLIFILFPFLSISFIFTTILIFIFDGRPIFYTEDRIGRNNLPFKILKFRTMKISQKGIIVSEKNQNILTKTGYFLRKWGIDELPQIINILKGDMSLVGPRPIPIEHPINSDKYRFRFKVKPGITGLAQINGRNKISWEKKIDFDKEYVNNYSLLLDLKILIKTIPSLFKNEHLY